MNKTDKKVPAAPADVALGKKNAENEKEQAEYYESFVKATKIVEERIQAERNKVLKDNPRASFFRHPYDRLKEMGAWDAKWISIQYYLVVGRLSTLPKALRDFILEIGAVARAEYEAKRIGEEQVKKLKMKKKNGESTKD